MDPDRQLALLRLFLQLFLFALVGAGSFYLGSLAAFSAWKSLAVAWGVCGVFLCFEQYRTATEELRARA